MLLASTIPTLLAYDPAFAYEIAVIIQDGMRRHVSARAKKFFITSRSTTRTMQMPAMPEGAEEGILKGLYKFKAATKGKKHKAHIFGSGPIMREALRAQEILGRAIRCSRRCLERDQLQATAQRRA